jgi:predicted FMN-binding regulatory protein PaiB
MYIPSTFEVTDKEVLYKFMEEQSFAVLFSQLNNVPTATHFASHTKSNRGLSLWTHGQSQSAVARHTK